MFDDICVHRTVWLITFPRQQYLRERPLNVTFICTLHPLFYFRFKSEGRTRLFCFRRELVLSNCSSLTRPPFQLHSLQWDLICAALAGSDDCAGKGEWDRELHVC